MQNLKLIFAALLLLVHVAASSQNMGVGTDIPSKKLSVAGSIAVDHDNENTGTLDSAALVFGTGPSLVGIFSQKTPGSGSYNGLDFWTNGQRRMIITEGGTVGINVENPDPNTDLFVGGHIRSYSFQTSNLTATANAWITGAVHAGSRVNINGNEANSTYRLTVNDGNSYFGGQGLFTGLLTTETINSNAGINATGNIHSSSDLIALDEVRGNTLKATSYMGVGGAPDPVYRLRVWDGNSRFGGDVQVTGNLNAGEITTSTINGKGVVHSDGSSSLGIGFLNFPINITLSGGNQTDYTVSVNDFDGTADNIRVFICQFAPDPLPQYANWHDFSFHVHSVDSTTDTCKVRITNTTGGNLSIKGTLYLATCAKD